MFPQKPFGFAPGQSRRGFSAVPSSADFRNFPFWVVDDTAQNHSVWQKKVFQAVLPLGGYGLSNTVPLSHYET